jgi:hypothetical protein
MLFAVWFGLEWHQQQMPGRIPDVTDPLVALLAWWVAWGIPLRPPLAENTAGIRAPGTAVT